MGLNFPNVPTTGQQYPSPAVAGIPIYTWDGVKWAGAFNGWPSIATGQILADTGQPILGDTGQPILPGP
jgi:hypothetical protein